MNQLDISDDIYFITEDTVYQIIDKFDKRQVVDRSLVYCFSKAFFMYCVKLYIEEKKIKIDFNDLYVTYKEKLKEYYKTNNPNISDDLLDQVLNFFDNSFGLVSTIEILDVEDSYEFRHYTVKCFELLHMILEKKSKTFIPDNIFDNCIKNIILSTEEIFSKIDFKIKE